MVDVQFTMQRAQFQQLIRQLRIRIHTLRDKMHGDALMGRPESIEDKADLAMCELIRAQLEAGAYLRQPYRVDDEATAPHAPTVST